MPTYPWYELVGPTDGLLQGDIIPECPVIIPPSSPLEQGERIRVNAEIYDVVVMSQSCDIEQGNVDIALVCPLLTPGDWEEQSDIHKSKRGRELLKQGAMFGYHLLDRSTLKGLETSPLIVDFYNVYGVHLGVLRARSVALTARLRLCPPYREHLSQAFARYFMRVGLPVQVQFDGSAGTTKPASDPPAESGAAER